MLQKTEPSSVNQEIIPDWGMISVVVPLYNEEANIRPLCEQATSVLQELGGRWEIVLVNDGSRDGSLQILDELAHKDQRIKVIHLSRNFGQTAAMMAGLDHAAGDVIIPMDGDLQNDPRDIPRLLEKLAEGYDVVSGWRKARKDHPLKRNLLSRVANWLISWISGVHLHDYGCSLKAYRKRVIKGVKLYGEMHRFVPIYANWQGARIAEIPVTHHPRKHGTSKYGMERIIKVLFDLISVKFLAGYFQKPMYIFGIFGFLSLFVGFVSGLYALYLKFFEGTSFIETPLPLLVVMTTITGIMFIMMGLLAELIVRTYYESQAKPVYVIRETRNTEDAH